MTAELPILCYIYQGFDTDKQDTDKKDLIIYNGEGVRYHNQKGAILGLYNRLGDCAK